MLFYHNIYIVHERYEYLDADNNKYIAGLNKFHNDCISFPLIK